MLEFDLIRRLQERICLATAAHGERCVLGIGDDAAVLEPPADRQLVACTDSMVEGVHFPVTTAAASIGHKALAVNLSDLAAMGAEPAWFLLSLTLPSGDPGWLDEFADGMAGLAARSGILLVGGDVTSGPLNVCITALGLIERDQALTRSGARPGDLVVVSGRPGAAAQALRVLESGGTPAGPDRLALDYPVPRLELGRALRGVATSCIDLSDGLLADLGHVLEASGVGAVLELERLPCPGSMAERPPRDRWPLQLAGGDDYELCFTIPAAESARIPTLERDGGVLLTVIGTIQEQPGLTLVEPGGGLYHAVQAGYEHFRDPGGGGG